MVVPFVSLQRVMFFLVMVHFMALFLVQKLVIRHVRFLQGFLLPHVDRDVINLRFDLVHFGDFRVIFVMFQSGLLVDLFFLFAPGGAADPVLGEKSPARLCVCVEREREKG